MSKSRNRSLDIILLRKLKYEVIKKAINLKIITVKSRKIFNFFQWNGYVLYCQMSPNSH